MLFIFLITGTIIIFKLLFFSTKLIFDFSEAVNKSNFKHSSDDEIITSIGKWLTCAKGRLEKKEIK